MHQGNARSGLGRPRSLFWMVWLALAAACQDDPPREVCTPATEEGCPDGQVCEETVSGEPACFAPVLVSGRVFDLASGDGIDGARVVIRDENGAALGDVATSGEDGAWAARVPVVRTGQDGAFDGGVVTLRVDAAGWASYPDGFRPALPVDLDDAVLTDVWTVATPTTDVALLALPGDPAALGAIEGHVGGGTGTLVVATGPAGTGSGVAAADGSYAIVNLPAGRYTLSAYQAGAQYEPATVDVPAGGRVVDVDLTRTDAPTNTVSGKIEIVNAPGLAVTSLVFVVEATFHDAFGRGEVPPGLRVANLSGTFEIDGVPDGRYVVLAGLENDGLVRDPDTKIGQTELVRLELAGGAPVTGAAFKVTEALEVVGPGSTAPEAVSAKPTFTWVDDAGEDRYGIAVYDAFGQLVWERDDLPPTKGSDHASTVYDGPPLEPGLYYQWRATSFHKGVPHAMTEDLRGLFFVAPSTR